VHGLLCAEILNTLGELLNGSVIGLEVVGLTGTGSVTPTLLSLLCNVGVARRAKDFLELVCLLCGSE
jgi:hypothetical protein